MSDDKIAEIRARHEEIDAWVEETRTFGPTAAHTDRATLLAEVERLRFVLRDTAEDLESSDPTSHKLLARIIRKALEAHNE